MSPPGIPGSRLRAPAQRLAGPRDGLGRGLRPLRWVAAASEQQESRFLSLEGGEPDGGPKAGLPDMTFVFICILMGSGGPSAAPTLSLSLSIAALAPVRVRAATFAIQDALGMATMVDPRTNCCRSVFSPCWRMVSYNCQRRGGLARIADLLTVLPAVVLALQSTGVIAWQPEVGTHRQHQGHYSIYQWPYQPGSKFGNSTRGVSIVLDEHVFPPESLRLTAAPDSSLSGRVGAARFRLRNIYDYTFIVMYFPPTTSNPIRARMCSTTSSLA